MGVLMTYKYDTGEGRWKHKWNKDEAGFCPSHRGPVGKCHSSITTSIAQELLDRAVAQGIVEQYAGQNFPHRIFAVYRGIPYVAVPTSPGQSYHGYPWRGVLSPAIRCQLADMARNDGKESEFSKWLKKYGK